MLHVCVLLDEERFKSGSRFFRLNTVDMSFFGLLLFVVLHIRSQARVTLSDLYRG